MTSRRPNIAVVGSGVAGLMAARSLARHCQVTVLEARKRVGGHVRTIDCGAPGGVGVDTGFIVFNRATYPQFSRVLDELDIASRPTNMAFSVRTHDYAYGSANLSSFFAQRRNLLRPSHYRFLGQILRFLRFARRDLGSDQARRVSLPAYLDEQGLGDAVTNGFAIPLASALWSMAPARASELPAETFFRFLEQHGMLRPVFPPKWRTVVGGSRRYVDALIADAAFEVETDVRVTAVERTADGIVIRAGQQAPRRYDRVVLAVHADHALGLLDAPTDAETRVLGAFRYSDNEVCLHTDERYLPAAHAARASWNYDATGDRGAATVTYWMNHLQGIPGPTQYCVTLNPAGGVDPERVIDTTTLRHPILDFASLRAQPSLPSVQGTRRTYYCGAYFGFGFHEDGTRAGLAAAARCLADIHREGAVA